MTAPRYLYPYHKRLETLSALYAGGYGVNLLHLGPSAPLAWAGAGAADTVRFALAICLAALVHGLGVWINGRWRWSPFLRLLGMTAHASLFAWLAWRGAGSTGGYTYGCVALFLAYGAKSAGIDAVRAWTGEGAWKAI